jgi:methionyl aminopeptidase
MLSEDILEKYHIAGKIAARVREEIKRIIKVGMPIIEICEKTEGLIRELRGEPAFPCNVSVNEIAAHYTSPPNDKKVIPEDSLVKIDIGVHVDGYIADTAVSVCFDPEYESMVRSVEEALERAVKIMRPGILVSHLGSEIQKVVQNRGFKPVSNLTGHQIGRYTLHTGKSLPNIAHSSINKIQVGEVYAIEPFVTLKEAKGVVENGSEAHIFRFIKSKPVKEAEIKQLMRFIETNFKTLPFAERWLKNYSSIQQYKNSFEHLLSIRCLMAYPVFVEVSRKPVAQAEHTVYIDKEKAIVLT